MISRYDGFVKERKMNMNEVLKIQKINKRFGKQKALEDVSMTIKQGEIYGLIGRNGAGKTTLLKSVLDMLHADSGEISLFGATDRRGYLNQMKRVGSIIENPVAYDQLTALENLRYYCKIKGIVEPRAAEEALKAVDLQETGKKKFKNFSLGMKQKLGLAIALLNQPDLLILDEPINGLDPVAIVEFRDLLLKLNREQHMTILISSHILEELYLVANRFGFIRDGRLIEELTKEEFEERNQSFIHLLVEDTAKASFLLKQAGISEYKVVSEGQINIYQQDQPIRSINKLLVTNDIAVDAIYLEGESLESYFKELVMG